MTRAAARRTYLAADAKLGDAQARHRHWNISLTAQHLAAAQQRARKAYAAYRASVSA